MRVRSVFFCCAGSLMAVLLGGCLETSVVYNPNLYQTGRSNGTNKVHAHLIGGSAPEIHSSMYSSDISTNANGLALGGSPGLSVGVSDRVDVGGSLELGVAGPGNSAGTRLYVKDMFTNRQSPWAFSLLPAVVYMHGSNGSDDVGASMASHLMAFEVHGPVSYHVSRYLAVFAEPQLLLAWVSVPFTAGPNELSRHSRTHHETWAGEGLGVGLQAGPIFPEVSILHLGRYTHWLGGLALSF